MSGMSMEITPTTQYPIYDFVVDGTSIKNVRGSIVNYGDAVSESLKRERSFEQFETALRTLEETTAPFIAAFVESVSAISVTPLNITMPEELQAIVDKFRG